MTTKVAIAADITEDGDYLQLQIVTEDASRLTPQQVLDAVVDYLLVDPDNLFSDSIKISNPNEGH